MLLAEQPTADTKSNSTMKNFLGKLIFSSSTSLPITDSRTSTTLEPIFITLLSDQNIPVNQEKLKTIPCFRLEQMEHSAGNAALPQSSGQRKLLLEWLTIYCWEGGPFPLGKYYKKCLSASIQMDLSPSLLDSMVSRENKRLKELQLK